MKVPTERALVQEEENFGVGWPSDDILRGKYDGRGKLKKGRKNSWWRTVWPRHFGRREESVGMLGGGGDKKMTGRKKRNLVSRKREAINL